MNKYFLAQEKLALLGGPNYGANEDECIEFAMLKGEDFNEALALSMTGLGYPEHIVIEYCTGYDGIVVTSWAPMLSLLIDQAHEDMSRECAGVYH